MSRDQHSEHCGGTALSHGDTAAVVRLAMSSDAPFNRALDAAGLSFANIESSLDAALRDTASDMHHLDLERVDNDVIGMVCACPTSQVAARRIATLRYLVSTAPDKSMLRSVLNTFSEGIPTVTGEGLYLSRIAVDTRESGKGIGARLMERFEARARDEAGSRAFLHVAIENAGALGFYAHLGYEVVGTGSSHVLLSRNMRDST